MWYNAHEGVRMSSVKQTRLYYISDTAYQHLIMLATRQGYKKLNTERAVGISEFLSDLAYYDFSDTRPYQIVERHKQEIENNRAPTWTSYSVRRTRMLYITLPSIQRYVQLALKVGIIRREPYLYGNVSITKPVSIVGYVIEAIGLKWLTPNSYPLKRTALE